jgi:hypothetical protein
MINNILNLKFKNLLWLYFIRRLSRFNKIFFVPTKKLRLPRGNHPLGNLYSFFDDQLDNFKKNNLDFNLDLYRVLKKKFKKNSKICLLDYGGENLDLYLFLKKKFSKIKIVIINQPQVNKVLKKIILNKKIKNLSVIENINQANLRSFNFINFGSSLQYINNYEKILIYILKKTKGFFYLSASSFFFNRKFKKNIVVKQVNLLPSIFYCYIFNFLFIKRLFAKYKYYILFKKQNSYKKVNFYNFKINIKYLNILFFKK